MLHRILIFSLVLFSIMGQSCQKNENVHCTSPDGKIAITFLLTAKGEPAYLVHFNNKTVIDTSKLGFEFEGMPALKEVLRIVDVKATTVQETWEMPWGEQRFVKNHCHEKVVELQETTETARKLNIIFRAYNDGIGFRYEFPEENSVEEILITEEKTEFNLAGDHQCWWIPGDWDIYEHLYNTTKFSEIDALEKAKHVNLAQTYIPVNAVNTPVTMKTADGTYLSFHEANLTDYAGMTLLVDAENLKMTSNLVGSDRTGYKVKRQKSFKTPWRTIQIAEKGGDLIESKLIVNLNEPSKIDDMSWFKPTKYTGIWWEMHLFKSYWDKASGKHGATTENAKKLIDFSAANNIHAMLVEGWNTGWEKWIGFEDREGIFDFVTPYDDYNLQEVVAYGKSKGIELIMHHETSSAPRTYEQQMDTAYALMKNLGIHAVKTGYVGKIIPKGEYHHGQWMVNHYRKVLETAAKYQVAINAHEPIKATGIRRTYPNAISREGLRGQEFNAWASDGGNPPEHLPIVAFTRMLAGPIDFTPGIFDIKFDQYRKDNQVNTTLAQQLALYVVIYSPVQMAADLMENYEGHPAFQFISDVGVDWEQSKVLNGEIGDYVTIAREERETGHWFIGSITDENPREMTIDLDFLPEGVTFEATLYVDGNNAHWDDNPTDYKIEKTTVTHQSTIDLKLAAGGGAAISLKRMGN